MCVNQAENLSHHSSDSSLLLEQFPGLIMKQQLLALHA